MLNMNIKPEDILDYITHKGFTPAEGCEIYEEKILSYDKYDIEINKNNEVTFFVNGIEVFKAKNSEEYFRLYNIINNILK